MIRVLALCVLATLAAAPGPARAAMPAASLVPADCPFALPVTAASHRAVCYTASIGEAEVRVTLPLAVLTPLSGLPERHLLYIPGGPGDAPVSNEGPPAELRALFPKARIVAFNPRGTAGTEPRLHCDFGTTIWEEDFSGALAFAQVERCRAANDALLQRVAFDAPAIAGDADALIRALGIERAGLFAVSYGTEAALHLLAAAPRWLDFAILDSVSLPGTGGIGDELAARDRFLAELSQRCFRENRCGALVAQEYAGLREWAAQFDAAPLTFRLGPVDAEWALDGAEMLDYLYELSAFPTGIEIAARLVAELETSRLTALAAIRADLAATIDFAAGNLALSMEAFSDSEEPGLAATLEEPRAFPTDVQSWRDLVDVYKLWNAEARREPPFVSREAPVPEVSPTPVLILSGGLDAVTPVAWAARLSQRFSGLERYVFPGLGHAVSFGSPADTVDSELATELRCVRRLLRRFGRPGVAMTASPACSAFRVESGDDR